MLLSKYLLPTLKEIPQEAEVISHKLMLRAGLMRKLASGIYEYLPMGLRVVQKIENIIRDEMNRIGGQEVYLPAIHPKELWEETGRWSLYGKELMRFEDRHGRKFCLGPTHEEVITDLVRRDVRSYRELPLMLYQFQIKFRDEIRPRFGVMRAREFYMKDAYSFDASKKDSQESYDRAFEAYHRICKRCGFRYRAVEAETGLIGGSSSHEFMVLANTGEEELVVCSCGYGANIERAECVKIDRSISSEKKKPLEEVHTPNIKSVEDVGKFLKQKSEKFIKTMVYMTEDQPIIALVRGDYELNPSKIAKWFKVPEVTLADEDTIKDVSGAPLGFTGPVGLRKRVKMIGDYSIANIVNGISGANKKDYHLKNINMGRDFKVDAIVDLRRVKENDSCPRCGKKLNFLHGIEVGHTFRLGNKYSKSMKATFLDKKGKERYFVMGCYGIGVTRMVAAAIEQGHDENGIIWPVPIAPFQILILPTNYQDKKIKSSADMIYSGLLKRGYEVILDDRDARPGVKFKDADLTGIPIRITIGEKSLRDGKIEVKLRKEKDSKRIGLAQVGQEVEDIFTREQSTENREQKTATEALRLRSGRGSPEPFDFAQDELCRGKTRNQTVEVDE